MPNKAVVALRRFVGAVSSAFRPKMQTAALSPVDTGRGWFNVFDWQPGAWQQDLAPVNMDRALSNFAVFACLRLISSDLGKLRLRLVELGEDGIWRETRSNAFSPVLRKPNSYQTRQKFIESWALSKLGPAGNAYIFKVRDRRGLVVELHPLDPWRVTPLISPSGMVFYRLGEDPLATIPRDVEAVPASEIIHDRGTCLFHPLVGVSPLYASALAATQGLSIQNNAEWFFRNRSMPGGVLTVPTGISDETAEDLKRTWNARYTGENSGRTAVLTHGMKYEPLNVGARDSQLAEQLNLTAKAVCAAYGVPAFKIGFDTLPAGQRVEDMNRIYYADCLQALIESMEALLDEGLGLELSGKQYGTEFDLDDLLRMDTPTMVSAIAEAIGAGAMAPNEGRLKMNLGPVSGGNSPYLQQQNYSLSALAKRDAQEDPFGSTAPAPQPAPAEDDEEVEETAAEMTARVLARMRERFAQ